jgi:hypothetical protein
MMARAGAPIVALALAGCAQAPAALDAPRIGTDVAIAPYASYRECMALREGERISYRFATSAPVAFSIRFRQDSATVLPVDVASTTAEDADLAIQQSADYCLLWEAGAAGSMLEYRVQPVRPRR